jgi:hypothetical protein
LRQYSPDGAAVDSLRVVAISFAVAVAATALFVAALKVSARQRAATATSRKGVTS